MKKSVAWVSLILVLAVMFGFAYIMQNGVDEAGSGAVKNTKLGLDLAGGVSITYEAVGDGTPSKTDIEDTIEKLRKRVEKYSTESSVYQEGTNRISIEIPGVQDAEAVLKDLGSPGNLYFIRATATDGTLNYNYWTSNSGAMVYGDNNGIFVEGDDQIRYLLDVSTNDIALDETGAKIPYVVEDETTVKLKYRLNKTIEELEADGSIILTGTDVQTSEGKTYTDEYSVVQNIVSLKFNDTGAETFGAETTKVASLSGIPGTIAIIMMVISYQFQTFNRQ